MWRSLQFRQVPQATLNGTEQISPTLDALDMRAHLDHLAGILVAHLHSRRAPQKRPL